MRLIWRYLFTVAAICTGISALVLPKQAAAVPAFARQMSSPCTACHFQHFPKLNAFGRVFKANGYSMTAQSTLDDEKLSIAPNLNVTLILKTRYVDDSSKTDGEWQFPDEAAIFGGGRLADGIGGLVEWAGPLTGAKVSFTRDFLNIGRGGVTLYTTDALGAGYGFEVMNTGAVRNHRPFERSAKPTLGNNGNLDFGTAATGVTVFVASPNWFITGAIYVPDSRAAGASSLDAGLSLSNYVRAAWMPAVRGWDTGVGVGVYGGSTTVTTLDDGNGLDAFGNIPGIYKLNTSAWFVDAQAQGQIKGHDLGLYFMYGEGDDPSLAPNEVNLFAGAPGFSKPKGWGLDLEMALVQHLDVLLSVGAHDNGDPVLNAAKTWGVGLYWQIAQNIALQPMYENIGGDQGKVAGKDVERTTVTFEASF